MTDQGRVDGAMETQYPLSGKRSHPGATVLYRRGPTATEHTLSNQTPVPRPTATDQSGAFPSAPHQGDYNQRGTEGQTRFSKGPAMPTPQDAAATGEPTVDGATEAVITGALKWLAASQGTDGAWFTGNRQRPQHAVAMTGYTLMAFMAAGQLPDEGEYHEAVKAGMQFLLDTLQPDGLFRGVDGSKYMYNHGIATIALAELYGQSKSRTIRPSLERLIQVIVSTQNNEGGWRYQPRPDNADISVTVLQVVALRAAKNAGLDVPQSVIVKAEGYVRKCYDENTGGFGYQPGSRRSPGYARTAAAIYSLQVCGLYDDPMVKAGSAYLFKADDKQFWSYGSYYAAPAQAMVGGETWRNWYEKMKKSLLDRVKRDAAGLCHWEVLNGDPGPLYTTAVAVNILAAPYHYVPLYQR